MALAETLVIEKFETGSTPDPEKRARFSGEVMLTQNVNGRGLTTSSGRRSIAGNNARGTAYGNSGLAGNNPALRSALGQLGAAVLPAVLGEVLGSNNQGGLGAIVARLEQAGFGDQVKSWLGNGQNLPIIAPTSSAQVLGNDTVRQLAARYQHPGRPAEARSWPRSCPRPWIRRARTASLPHGA